MKQRRNLKLIWFSKSISACSMKTLAFTYRWYNCYYQLEIEFCCTLVKNDFLLVCTEIVALKMLIFRSSSPEVLCKKVVKNLTQFTGKHQKKFNNKKWNSKEVQGCERNLIKRRCIYPYFAQSLSRRRLNIFHTFQIQVPLVCFSNTVLFRVRWKVN